MPPEDNPNDDFEHYACTCGGSVVETEETQKIWQCGKCHQKVYDNHKAKLGTVVQIHPDHPVFSGCFALVVETFEWGVQGFVAIPKGKGQFPGEAHVRLKWDRFETIGETPYQPEMVEVSPLILPPSVRPS